MKTVRYPFKKKTLPTWVEVPFDATDRNAGTVEVQLVDLPTEKLKSLTYQLTSATSTYLSIKSAFDTARALADGQPCQPVDEELSVALEQIRSSDKIRPNVKRLLVEYIQSLHRARSPEESLDPAQQLLDVLVETAPAFGDIGFAVLSFAQTLIDTDRAIAKQRVSEDFENRLSEAVAALSRAREKIVAFGLSSHRGFRGQVVDDEGKPLLDEEGNQVETDLPFEGRRWVWNGRERIGVAQAGLEFYKHASPTGGLLVSLSEAVLLYQSGTTPTPEDIWSKYAPLPAAAPVVAGLRVAAAPGRHPDDEEAAPFEVGQR